MGDACMDGTGRPVAACEARARVSGCEEIGRSKGGQIGDFGYTCGGMISSHADGSGDSGPFISSIHPPNATHPYLHPSTQPWPIISSHSSIRPALTPESIFCPPVLSTIFLICFLGAGARLSQTGFGHTRRGKSVGTGALYLRLVLVLGLGLDMEKGW